MSGSQLQKANNRNSYFADCYDCPVYNVLCIRLVNDTYLANI